MATKALKGVSDEKWAEFKAIAASRNMPMGELFNEAVDALAEEKSESQWEKLLSWKAKDPKEVEGIEERIKEFRKGFKLRRFK